MIKKHKKQIITLVALYLVGVLFLAFTNPNDLPVPLLILPFIYSFSVLYVTLVYLGKALRLRRQKLIALTISILVTLLLLLGSLHQLGPRDIFLASLLAVLLTWYINANSHRPLN